jgi:hypothetical protein
MPRRTYGENVARISSDLRARRRYWEEMGKIGEVMDEGRRLYDRSIELAREFNGLVDEETREAFWGREDVNRAIKRVDPGAVIDFLKAAMAKWQQNESEV